MTSPKPDAEVTKDDLTQVDAEVTKDDLTQVDAEVTKDDLTQAHDIGDTECDS